MNAMAGPPQDFFELLEKNYREQRPLLEGAQVYRCTSTPVQEGGVVSDQVMHAALIPRVATQYTSADSSPGKPDYMGAYPLDRNAVFYKDWQLEKALAGEPVRGMTVPQAEALLRPQVERLLGAGSESSRAVIKSEIELLVKNELHETGLRLRKPDGAPVEGKLFYYTGQGAAGSNQEALKGMVPVTDQNSKPARGAVFDRYRGPTTNTLRALRVDPGLVRAGNGVTPVHLDAAKKALDRLTSVSQSTFSQELREAYGNRPINELAKAAADHPVSRQQAQLRDLGAMLHEAVHSPDIKTQRTGLVASKMIASMPDTASYKELCGAMGQAARQVQAEFSGRGPEGASQFAPPQPKNPGAGADRSAIR